MQDGAPCHKAKMVTKSLEGKNIGLAWELTRQEPHRKYMGGHEARGQKSAITTKEKRIEKLIDV